MVKNNFWLLRAGLLAAVFSGFVFTEAARAGDAAQVPPAERGGTQQALARIEARLAVMEANQEKILANQQKLSEEHTQLRYWIHRN